MPLSPCLLFSLARARLSMAILVTRPAADTIAPWNPAEGRVKRGGVPTPVNHLQGRSVSRRREREA
jgi:hypothetical protein